MAVYGGLQTWVAVLINAALIAYLALFPALFALIIAADRDGATGRRALMAAPLVWVATELGRTLHLHRLSVGAARLQPGDRPADRAAREPLRRLRRVDAGRGRQRGAGVCGCRSRGTAVRSGQRASAAPVAVHRVVAGDRACWGSRRVAATRVDAHRRADPRRPDPGQRRSGREVGRRARVGDLPGLPGHDAPGDSRRAPSSSSGPSRRRRSSSRTISPAAAEIRDAGAAGTGADPLRQRSDRARRGAPTDVLQLRVSGPRRRHDRRRLPQDAPGAVRRVRAAQAICCSSRRRSSRRSARFSRRASTRRCCRSTAIASAPRSATRSSTRISCASSSPAAASC